jgi:hypothetical protein
VQLKLLRGQSRSVILVAASIYCARGGRVKGGEAGEPCERTLYTHEHAQRIAGGVDHDPATRWITLMPALKLWLGYRRKDLCPCLVCRLPDTIVDV